MLPVLLGATAPAGDFADGVVDYTPAPGQFVNDAQFNDPARALGAPVGGGTAGPDNSKLVTLGGFGGSITLRFSTTVLDDPLNRQGLDAIVFGNAYFAAGDPTVRWAEGAIVEICRDENDNGIPDEFNGNRIADLPGEEQWYVIPGSHIPTTAPGGPGAILSAQLWDDDPGTATPPSNTSWFPAWMSRSYTTTTFHLPTAFEQQTLANPAGPGAIDEEYWGYAELTPALVLGDTDGDNIIDDPALTPEEFYTSPDNPFVVGVTPGSAGGDAFDIAWAVHPVTGELARLDGFDFIRISTGVDSILGVLGEMSAEIGGVADTRPDPAYYDFQPDAQVDVEDLYTFVAMYGGADPVTDLTGEGTLDEADVRMMARAARAGEQEDVQSSR